MLSLIENDLFDIARRVREFDPALSVYYNHNRGCFEIHDARAKGGTYVMSANKLDARVIDRLYKASLENRTASDLIRDIEDEDRRRERRAEAKLSDLAHGFAEDFKYAGRVVSGYGGSG